MMRRFSKESARAMLGETSSSLLNKHYDRLYEKYEIVYITANSYKFNKLIKWGFTLENINDAGFHATKLFTPLKMIFVKSKTHAKKIEEICK